MTSIEPLRGFPRAHGPAAKAPQGRDTAGDGKWTIRAGTMQDYSRLARFHYRATAPATCIRIWTASLEPEGHVIGVLILSMPVLNGPWRAIVWPQDFASSLDPRERACRLNRQRTGVRCISRLIVDPSCRALGVGSSLVRWALAHSPTTRTEAVAAMGLACPVFERAGMRQIDLPPSARDRRLLDALRRARIPEWQLVDVRAVVPRFRRDRGLLSALRTWANDARGTRGLARGPIPPLIEAAAISLANRGRKVVYVHDAD